MPPIDPIFTYGDPIRIRIRHTEGWDITYCTGMYSMYVANMNCRRDAIQLLARYHLTYYRKQELIMVTTQLFRLQNIVKICAALNCVFFRLLQIKWFLIRPLTQICIFEGTVGQSRTSTWRLKCVKA